MDFEPPKNATVLTAEDLAKLTPARMSGSKPVYELKGPLHIKGDVVGKILEVVGGGLWIDGNVENSHINLDTSRIRSAEDRLRSDESEDAVRLEIQELYKEAAENGVGLHIQGDVKKCGFIIAPSLQVSGNVIGGSDRLADRGDLCAPGSHIRAPGGSLHIGGNVTGGEAQQRLADDTNLWYLPGVNPRSQLRGKTAAEDMYIRALDILEAHDNVLIKGAVTGVGIGSESGSVMIRGEKNGWVILNNKGNISIGHSPAQAAATPRLP